MLEFFGICFVALILGPLLLSAKGPGRMKLPEVIFCVAIVLIALVILP